MAINSELIWVIIIARNFILLKHLSNRVLAVSLQVHATKVSHDYLTVKFNVKIISLLTENLKLDKDYLSYHIGDRQFNAAEVKIKSC